MYKLIYYRFGEIKISRSEEAGYDSVRKSVIGVKDIKLTHFEEAFTSERWLVRIYKVLPLPAMDAAMTTNHRNWKVDNPLKPGPKMAKPAF